MKFWPPSPSATGCRTAPRAGCCNFCALREGSPWSMRRRGRGERRGLLPGDRWGWWVAGRRGRTRRRPAQPGGPFASRRCFCSGRGGETPPSHEGGVPHPRRIWSPPLPLGPRIGGRGRLASQGRVEGLAATLASARTRTIRVVLRKGRAPELPEGMRVRYVEAFAADHVSRGGEPSGVTASDGERAAAV